MTLPAASAPPTLDLLRFLAEASRILGDSLDYETTLPAVARLVVPTLADWCAVDVADEDGRLRRLAVAHVDPTKAAVDWELDGRLTPRPGAPSGTAAVFRTGLPLVLARLDEEMQAHGIDDPEQLALVRALGLRSLIGVPLMAEGRTLGVLSLLMADSGRHYGVSDLPVVQDLAARMAAAVANAWRHRAAQAARDAAERALARLQRLHALTAALSRALSPQAVADAVLAQIVSDLDARVAVVGLLDESGTALELVGSHGYPAGVMERYGRIPLDAGFAIASAARTGAPVYLESAAEIADRFPRLYELRTGLDVGATVAVPFVIDGRVVGALAFAFAGDRAFGPEDRAFVDTLAAHCAQALERARLVEAEQRARAVADRAAERIRRLQTVSDAAAAHLSLDALLPEALERLRSVLDADIAVLALLDAEGETLVPSAAVGVELAAVADTRIPLGRGFGGAIAADRAPRVVADLAAGDVDVVGRFLRDEAIRALVGAPLVLEDRVLGVVTLGARRPDAFSAGQVRLLEEAAARLAAAIDRSRMHEELRRRKHEFESLVEHSPDVIARLDRAHRHVYVNRAMIGASGGLITPAMLIGRTQDEVGASPELVARTRAAIERVFATGTPERFTFASEVLWAPGYVDNLIVPEFGPDGRTVEHVLLVGRDVTALTHATEAARASEARFRALFETAPLGISVGRAGRLLYVNPAFLRMFGYASAADVVGRMAQEFVAPGSAAAEIIQQRHEGGTAPVSYDGVGLRRDASTFPFHIEVTTIALDDGEAVVAFVADTSERDAALRAVRESERVAQQRHTELEATYATAPVGLCVLDHDLRYVRINEHLAELNGVPAAEHIGRTIHEIVPDVAHEAERVFRHVLDTGEPVIGFELTGETRAQPGVQRDWVESFFPLRDAAGAIVGVNVVAEEITERKRAEAARRTWADAFDFAAQGIVIVDPRTERIRFANRAFAGMHGLSVEEAVGRPLAEFYPAHLRKVAAQFDAAADREGSHTAETWRRRRDGSEFPALVSVTSVRAPDGSPSYRIATVEDLTERRRIEEQLRQAMKMEAVGRLAGGVAHDYNNLTTVITGYAEFALRQLPADDPVAGDVREIKRAGERAAQLTHQLLAFSRRQVLQPVVLDPNHAIADLSKMLGRLLGEHIELVLELAPGPGLVQVDRSSLDQVLVNLAVNARDAMPAGGRLTVRTEAATLAPAAAAALGAPGHGPHVLITVGDTGAGMDAGTLEHIFEPFFTTKPVGQGTGLGLAMAYGTIQQSGGTITARSTPGQGSEFRIYLPSVAPTPGAMPRTTPAPPRGRERVLVVEDDPGVLTLAARTLRAQGYEVRTADSADRALEVAAESGVEFDLLLTDVVMPGVGGRVLGERMRADQPQLRVLYMSGYTDDAVLAHGVSEASAPFLQKPFSPDALAEKIRAVLDAPSRGRPIRRSDD